MAVCDCDYSLQNTGQPNCMPLWLYGVHKILVPLMDSAGVENKIAAGATVNDAYIQARFGDTDKTQRWYPLKNIKNATMTRAEDVVEDFDDGTKNFIKEGVLTNTYLLASKNPTLLGKIKSFRCEAMGEYTVDKGGKIIGRVDSAGNCYPIAIEPNTLSAIPLYPTATSSYNIQITYDWRQDMYDEEIGAYGNTVNWSSSLNDGLRDVNIALGDTPATTTTFEVELTYDYGDVNNKLPVKGLVAADFTLAEVSPTPGAITITSVTETADGVYSFVIPTQTSADVLRLSASKTTFDFSRLADFTITIP